MFDAAGAARLEDLKPLDVENFVRGLRERNKGAKTRNDYLASVRSFYAWCIRTKRTSPESDPTVTLAKAAEAEDVRRERRVLTPDELARLLEAARTRPLVDMRDYRKHTLLRREEVLALERRGAERALIYKTAILTGLRLGELKQLTWGDLSLGSLRPMLRVRASVAKSGREDYLPVRKEPHILTVDSQHACHRKWRGLEWRHVPGGGSSAPALRGVRSPPVLARGR